MARRNLIQVEMDKIANCKFQFVSFLFRCVGEFSDEM